MFSRGSHVIRSERPETLVASTMSSRRVLPRFNQLPMYLSVRPCVPASVGMGYISAVSMKFTPSRLGFRV